MTARARFLQLVRGLLCATLLAAPSTAAVAQSVRVTSGEHAGFTRLVLQSREPFRWSLGEDGRERRLQVDAAVQFNPAEVFRVIPRTRLADLRRIEGGLALVLGCDCEISTDESVAGVLVLDIREAPSRVRPAPPPERTGASAPRDMARTAGGDLARRMRAAGRNATLVTARPPVDEPAVAALPLIEHLARQMSQAVAQGLLSAELAQRTALMPAAEGQTGGADLSNMRISLATEPPGGGVSAPTADACPAPELLTFSSGDQPPPFLARHAALMRSLYGEFDLPDADGHEALARLYLEHGFGAEARLVIENAPAPISGRDLLLGLSDILEDRYSNARLRLADRIDCAGSTALFAALAGAKPARIKLRALQIAGAYDDLPAPLRRALGEALVRRLLDAEAREAARMVADALRRLAGPVVPEMPLVEALLDAARGEVDRAAARLDHAGRKDGAALVVRLQLALERGEFPEASLLADAEAVAASERATDNGIELMSLLIRAHNATQRSAEAFELVDRLERWLPATPTGAARLAGLRDSTWAATVTAADDRGFLQTFFERTDWRRDALSVPTRLALAERLAEFGLTDPAGELVEAVPATEARHLRSRLRLLAGDPAAALAALSDLEDDAAVDLRAQAQRALDEAEAVAQAAPVVADFEPSAAEDTAPVGGGHVLMLRGATLLSESSHLRESLQDLLQSER